MDVQREFFRMKVARESSISAFDICMTGALLPLDSTETLVSCDVSILVTDLSRSRARGSAGTTT
jgi:hypothetical protein